MTTRSGVDLASSIGGQISFSWYIFPPHPDHCRSTPHVECPSNKMYGRRGCQIVYFICNTGFFPKPQRLATSPEWGEGCSTKDRDWEERNAQETYRQNCQVIFTDCTSGICLLCHINLSYGGISSIFANTHFYNSGTVVAIIPFETPRRGSWTTMAHSQSRWISFVLNLGERGAG